MTKEEAQGIANICIQFTKDEKGNKISDWSITTFLSKMKVELEAIVNKDNSTEDSKENKTTCGKK